MVNEEKIAPFPDEALPGFTVTKRLEADHIVPMDRITQMEGFDKLTFEQQLSVLNNTDNFIGLETQMRPKAQKLLPNGLRIKSLVHQ
jgi:hypothetical protein